MYRDLAKILRQYWSEYGALKDFLRSPFTHVSFIATALYSAGFLKLNWRELAEESLPTLLGFSLAAYTITFTLMGSALHRALSVAIDKKSGFPLIRIVNSTFFHVVVFQSLALFYAVLSRGSLLPDLVNLTTENREVSHWLVSQIQFWGNAVGCFLALYAFLLLLSVGTAMFRLGRLAPPAIVANANDDDAGPDEGTGRNVTRTRRFRFVAWLSKRLGLYQ